MIISSKPWFFFFFLRIGHVRMHWSAKLIGESMEILWVTRLTGLNNEAIWTLSVHVLSSEHSKYVPFLFCFRYTCDILHVVQKRKPSESDELEHPPAKRAYAPSSTQSPAIPPVHSADRYPNLKPPSFSKPSHCALGVPLALDKPRRHPSSSRPTSLRPPPPFSKPVQDVHHSSSPPYRRGPFAAPISKPAHSALSSLSNPKSKLLTPLSSSEPYGYLHISPVMQPLTSHSAVSPSLSLRPALSFGKLGKEVAPPVSFSSCGGEDDITGVQEDIPAVSCPPLIGLAWYQHFPNPTDKRRRGTCRVDP